MRDLLLLFAAFATLLTAAQTAPPIQWQRSMGGTGTDQPTFGFTTTDGGSISVGSSQSGNGDVASNQGNSDWWVVKLDGVGELEWQANLGGSDMDLGSMVQQTIDGGYIVVGSTRSTDGDVTLNHGSTDAWVVRLSAVGAVVWQRSYGGSDDDYGSAIEQTPDGGFIVLGGTRSTDGDVTGYHGGGDMWVLKLSSDGSLQWQKSLGGSLNESGASLVLSDDGGYLLAGSTDSTDGDVTSMHGPGEAWLVKLDAGGEIQWQRTYGGSSDEIANDITHTLDGGYFLVCSSLSNDGDLSENQGNYDIWVVKVDPLGEIEWKRSMGGSNADFGLSGQQLMNGDYVIAGSTGSNDGDITGFHGGSRDGWVIKLDDAGSLLWQKTLGGTASDLAVSISPTADNGLFVFGGSSSDDGDLTGNQGSIDFWIVRLGPDDVGIAENEAAAPFTLYPNPATDVVTIRFDRPTDTEVQLKLYNAIGQCTGTPVEKYDPQGATELHYSLDRLPSGMYEMHLSSGEGTSTQRFVKL